MSYWLGKHSVNEAAMSIASKHQIAVSPEPEGATYGWLVECRCGWQARVPRQDPSMNIDELKKGLQGIGQNHFDRHSLESVNKEIIWPSSLSPLEVQQEQPSPTPVQQSEAPLVVQQVPQPGTQQESQPAKSSQVVQEVKVDSPSPQQSTTTATQEKSQAPMQSPSTASPVTSPAPADSQAGGGIKPVASPATPNGGTK